MTFLCQNEPINEALITAARIAPHQVALVKPSKTQLKVLNAIKAGEKVTAAQIALRCDLSESWASTLLKRLYEKRYLQRTGGVRQYGGVEFSYSICWT
ncbi:helix-turn-helix domain-containing protein [Vibrio diazotrophicus]|uniref:MarR family transcriptional regulator n=1 Tax=Vibrio diazotrophicus TaxID=685 RepID=UPI0022AFD83F|nr:helix-turn-helix domain-containing protein [Vibrio diazotrophicus]MCZ4371168.1 helix-turn-helix domain-containing protein [Vibrio diazotrophicus]